MLSALAFLVVASPPLDLARQHVTEFEIDEALVILERAVATPPHIYADHVQLYELLGISYSYLDRTDEAAAAFDTLLMLDPGYAIGYTLSPKATFQFQRARERARDRVPPALTVSWPRDLSVAQQIPIVLEVVSDPRGFLQRAAVYWRVQGGASFERIDTDLALAGAYQTVTLPPVAPTATTAATVELYVVALDEPGSEVMVVASAEHPREVALSYEEPVPLYKRWWLWAGIGAAVAVGVGTVLLITRDPSPEVGGGFQWWQ